MFRFANIDFYYIQLTMNGHFSVKYLKDFTKREKFIEKK